jgi:predicted RNA-binding protein YlqC (UPF0109 family)
VSTPVADLTRVLRRMVDRPDEVVVTQYEHGRAQILEASLAAEDMGKVIGRQGRTVAALRALLRVRGLRRGERYELDILDE